jgi:lipoyl-dependent peroxiredoxin
MQAMYTAQAQAKAGRAGQVWSEDGQVDLMLALPKEMGGPGGPGTNPEQLFAAGYSACFHSAVLFVAGQQKLNTADSTVTGHVSIGMNDKGPGFMIGVTLEVSLPHLDQAAAEQLVHEAHQVCPYSNATRGNVDVQFKIKGA